jgi:hypothetical protein
VDADQDGLVNLLERAFATHPLEGSDHYTPFVSVQLIEDQPVPTFTYRSRKDEGLPQASGYQVEGLTYTVQHKQDLQADWQETDIQLVSAQEVMENPLVRDITVRPTSFPDVSNQHFFRLMIDQ